MRSRRRSSTRSGRPVTPPTSPPQTWLPPVPDPSARWIGRRCRRKPSEPSRHHRPDSADGPVEDLIDTERVSLHNDANAGVIGERFHSERNPDDMVYLTISSGVGAGSPSMETSCPDGTATPAKSGI